MNFIGDTLRKLRATRNKSQQEIADFVCIDRKTYANWESNQADVKGSYIPKLAEAFEVEISDLFNQSKTFNIEQKFENSTIDTNSAILMQKFDNSTINTAILILTDRDAIDRVLDAVKFNQPKTTQSE